MLPIGSFLMIGSVGLVLYQERGLARPQRTWFAVD
jgi:hypothetical protein